MPKLSQEEEQLVAELVPDDSDDAMPFCIACGTQLRKTAVLVCPECLDLECSIYETVAYKKR